MTEVESETVVGEREMNEYKEAFGLFDRDADGCVSSVEMATLLRSVGLAPTQTQVEDFIQRVDGERNTGLIQFDEFVDFCQLLKSTPDTDDDIKGAFRYLDKDNSGYISAVELRRILTTMGDLLTHEEVNEMFRDAEVEGNLISFDEFMTMMRK